MRANNAVTVTFSFSVQGYPNGIIQLLISGAAGPNFTIQYSTNLVDWLEICTTNAPAVPFNWTNLEATNDVWRFYRVVQ